MKIKLRSPKNLHKNKCPACGAQIAKYARFCPKCGTKVFMKETAQPQGLLASAERKSMPSNNSKINTFKGIVSVILTFWLSVIQAICLFIVLFSTITHFTSSITVVSLPELPCGEVITFLVGSLYSIIFGGIFAAIVTLIIIIINLSHLHRYFLSIGLSMIAGGLVCFPMMLFFVPPAHVFIIATTVLFVGSMLILNLCR